jgi:hypothetical protein
MPYGFHTLTRIASVVVFGVLAYRLHAAHNQGWLVAVGFLIVYNPVIPIHLGSKPIWTFVNFAGTAFAAIAIRRALVINADNSGRGKVEASK